MALKLNNNKPNINPKTKQPGFTIVELLIVIVIIGILATITIVSYTGITKKANESTLKSDLANSKKQFALYYTEHGVYPTGLNGNKCPTGTTNPNPDTNYCLKPSDGDNIEISEADGSKYKLTATKGTLSFSITEDSTPSVSVLLPESDWITVGTQRWARKNLNVGTIITSTIDQTNNGGSNIVEKYCYNNDEANCLANDNGGFYQWDEAMNYSTTEGVQGICPDGSHIPTDNDWKILEMSLGMTQAVADARDFRGTDQGIQILSGGSSGLNVPVAGRRDVDASVFYGVSSLAYLWSSSESGGGSAWSRIFILNYSPVYRIPDALKSYGFSVRCLGN